MLYLFRFVIYLFRNCRKSKANRSVLSTLRGTTSNKFKRNGGGSKNLQDILQRSQFQKKKRMINENFKENTPEFGCSRGLRLSSEDSGSESDSKPSTSTKAIQKDKKYSKQINSITQASSSSTTDLKKIHDNLQLMEQAKANMMKYESTKKASQKETVNIAELLMIGEAAEPNEKLSRNRPHNESDSDEGWEEVEGKLIKTRKYLMFLKKYEYQS